MKKVLFTVLCMSFLGLSAQLNQRFKFDDQAGHELKIVVKNDGSSSSTKRATTSDWFDYADAYNFFNGSGLETNAFVSWIQPDTNLSNIGTTGTKTKIAFHVLGRVNDPRDEVFTNRPARFSRHNTYTWDSIRFTQFYIRQFDSMLVNAVMTNVVDTVFIQYFVPAGLENFSYYYQTDPNKFYYYSCPKRNNYSKVTKLNSAAFKTDTIFLTKEWADSISFTDSRVFGRGISIPVNKVVPFNNSSINGNLAAHTITFKPMKPTKLGDTGLAFDGSTVRNLHNMYGLRLYAKTGVVVENTSQEAQNNSLITNFEVVYGQTVGIFKSYLPGTAFASTIFDATEYHLTSNTVSVNTVDANGNGIGNIYPNPSSGASEVLVPVKLSNAQVVTLTISDITGKVVKTITTECNAGDFDIPVSTLGLDGGLYTCTMVSGAFSATTKFVLN